MVTPLAIYKRRSFRYYKTLSFGEKRQLANRVNYYCKLKQFRLDDAPRIREQKFDSLTYYLDLAEYLRFFSRNNRMNFLPGDIIEIPEQPSLLKSRPIAGNNENSVVLKLDKLRHFNFIEDEKDFEDKIPKAVWRGVVHLNHRLDFVKRLYKNELCNVGGYTRKRRDQPWEKDFLNIPQQLEYRYVFCIEGIDVATNLKWAMSSNSLCMMPKPVYETWFMEGTLEAGKHYVELKSDYSDVDDKINYYNANPQEAKSIIENAHQFVAQFQNTRQEDMLSYMVLRKYFKRSGQLYR